MVFILAGIIVTAVALSGGKDENKASQVAATATPVSTVSPELQAQRKDMIDKLLAAGYFYKIEMAGKYPNIWIGQSFYSLPFDLKENAAGVTYSYYYGIDPSLISVTLYDSMTGKDIGYYSIYQGLKLK
jgi:hypothetical protein